MFDKDWKMELELFMKMDFSAAVASLKKQDNGPY